MLLALATPKLCDLFSLALVSPLPLLAATEQSFIPKVGLKLMVQAFQDLHPL